MNSGHEDDLPHEEDVPRLLASDLYRYFPVLDNIYRQRLHSCALKLGGNQDDADDLVQETFTRAFKALAGSSAEEVEKIRLWPWLRQIARNSFITMLRKRKIELVSYDTLDGLALIDKNEDIYRDTPETSFEKREFLQSFYERLKNLPQKYRTAVVFKHIMQLSYTEMADALGISVKEAKERVTYGLKQLRNAKPDQGRP